MQLSPTRTQVLITMDIADPLTLTKRGQRNILAICDHFTKHIKAFPMKTQTALEVTEKCLEYFFTFDILKDMLSNQSTNFTTA